MLIGLIGKIGSGKSTVANWLVENRNFTEYSFAQPLKEICRVLGVENNLLYGTQEEKLLLSENWNVSGRHFMQGLGCMFRDHFKKYINVSDEKFNVWTLVFMNMYDPSINTVVSDVRFLDEATAIRELGGILIRIDREMNRSGEEHAHRSEREMDQIVPDFVLNNDTTVKEMLEKVDSYIKMKFNVE